MREYWARAALHGPGFMISWGRFTGIEQEFPDHPHRLNQGVAETCQSTEGLLGQNCKPRFAARILAAMVVPALCGPRRR